MGQADLTKTTFQKTPKAGVETIDAYDTDKINSFVGSSNDVGLREVLTDIYPDLDPNKLQTILKDPRTNEYLGKTGTTLHEVFSTLSGLIPPRVSLSDVLGFGSLAESTDFFGQLKEYMGSTEYNKLDLGFITTMFDKFKLFKGNFGFESFTSDGGGFDFSAIKDAFGTIDLDLDGDFLGFFKGDGDDGDSSKSSWRDKLTGLELSKLKGLYGDLVGEEGTTNFIMEMAEKYGIAEKLMQSGTTSDLVTWVKDSSLPAPAKEFLFAEMVDLAATHGYGEMIDGLVANAGEKFTKHRRKRTVENVLRGYTKPDGLTPAAIRTEATRLVDLLNTIEADWNTQTIDGKKIQSTRTLINATYSAIDVLRFDDRTRHAALAFRARRPTLQSYKTLARRDLPFILFD